MDYALNFHQLQLLVCQLQQVVYVSHSQWADSPAVVSDWSLLSLPPGHIISELLGLVIDAELRAWVDLSSPELT